MNNPNNNLDNIYNELGKNVCLYPFFNGFYQTNHIDEQDKTLNSVRPCSIILNRDNPRCWDIDTTIADARIKIEDQASKKTLSEVVPEWAPYFE